jgi:hypothetical protein
LLVVVSYKIVQLGIFQWDTVRRFLIYAAKREREWRGQRLRERVKRPADLVPVGATALRLFTLFSNILHYFIIFYNILHYYIIFYIIIPYPTLLSNIILFYITLPHIPYFI